MSSPVHTSSGAVRPDQSTVWVWLLISVCFLWTGSAYISWLYHLSTCFGVAASDWMSEGVGYLFQSAGVIAVALVAKLRNNTPLHRSFLSAVLLLDVMCALVCLLVNEPMVVAIFGWIMNIFHGAIAGAYLMRLAAFCKPNLCGLVFGTAYAFGSIGSWLLSLVMDGAFLASNEVCLVYVLLAVASVLATVKLPAFFEGLPSVQAIEVAKSQVHLDVRAAALPVILLVGCAVALLSMTNQTGFYFPNAALDTDAFNFEFSRTFYAIGLIGAGYLNGRKLNYGSILCVVVLFFPFMALVLRNSVGAEAVLWAVAYIFLACFTVYRVMVFCRISTSRAGLLWCAGLGLAFGRIGEACGTFINVGLGANVTALLIALSVCFAVTVVVFFVHYQKLYGAPSAKEAPANTLATFEEQYDISRREADVLRVLLSGATNSEIAAELYISDNTVKTHVRNLLRKTETANRTELIRLVKTQVPDLKD